MKKQFLLLAIMLGSASVFAQWNLGGNNNVNTTNNILGSLANTNIPVRFQTNGVDRMKLNETVSYQVNAQPSLGRDGFLLLGRNTPHKI